MEIKIGLLGLGTVGSGAFKIINSRKNLIKEKTGYEVNIKKILVKHLNKQRGINGIERILTVNIDDIIYDKEIKIVIEAIGGTSPTYEYIKKALYAGKHVITANKELIAKHGVELYSLAKEFKVQLKYEASVAGAIPIIHQIEKLNVTDNINYICGIVNGTTNYILTQMINKQCSFLEALKQAQILGYAESNPDNDIKGYDALYKLVILIRKVFGANIKVNSIYRRGIDEIKEEDIEYFKKLNYTVKLLAWAKNVNGNIYAGVEPVLINNDNVLSHINDVKNAVIVRGDNFGEYIFIGKGAGQLPTGDAIVSDLLNILFGFNINEEITKETKYVYNNNLTNTYYIRLKIKSKFSLKNLFTIFSDNGISFINQIYENNTFIAIFIADKSDIDSLKEVLENSKFINIESFYKVLMNENDGSKLEKVESSIVV
ncbi:homoserine dehydrogenase [Thermoanaerobacterium sp. RBIITD]|uniref:homoserine dehydrogenase n=1 Tax=Thermoanaerobacterium sp. RBIITD TaxID=1550240 RepID=UPI000BB68167|nr:homoserine dehydrogenase [Thermoanaerobacterium sp. RBIITD]SNX52719.1 homoserine dehydrogenase [Thermoanaerobacterium sp. RBIITD]